MYQNNILYQDKFNNVFLFTGKRRNAGKYKGWHQIIMMTSQGFLTTYVKSKTSETITFASDKKICQRLTGFLFYTELYNNPRTTKNDWAWWNENYLL